jgi:hypothetical protein
MLSVWGETFSADFTAFVNRIRGVLIWNSSTIYTPGQQVLSPGDGNVYQVKSGQSPAAGTDPAGDPTNWERWGHTEAQLQELMPVATASIGSTGVSASAGATLGVVIQSSMGGSTIVREVLGTVIIPLTGGSGGTSIVLAGAAAFASGIYCRMATNSDPSVTPGAVVSCDSGGGPNVANILVTGASTAASISVSFRLTGY